MFHVCSLHTVSSCEQGQCCPCDMDSPGEKFEVRKMDPQGLCLRPDCSGCLLVSLFGPQSLPELLQHFDGGWWHLAVFRAWVLLLVVLKD